MKKFKADVFNCRDNGPSIRLLIHTSQTEMRSDLISLSAAADLLNLLQTRVERLERALMEIRDTNIRPFANHFSAEMAKEALAEDGEKAE